MTIAKTIDILTELRRQVGGVELEDALETAISVLDNLQLIRFNAYAIGSILDAEEDERKAAEKERIRKEKEKAELMAMPIVDLDLSVRSCNCLRRRRVTTVGEIMALETYEELCRTRNLGRRSAEEICSKLAQFGLKLEREAPND